MIVLDTNVLSELIKPEGSARIVEWADSIRRDRLFTSAITQAEILYGLAIMEPGRRRDARLAAAQKMFDEDFIGRILPFDSRAAEHFAAIVSDRRRRGARIELLDGQIAAIARANVMSVATRNVGHFRGCGINLVNPWETD